MVFGHRWGSTERLSLGVAGKAGFERKRPKSAEPTNVAALPSHTKAGLALLAMMLAATASATLIPSIAAERMPPA